jgi:hypothetical protein
MEGQTTDAAQTTAPSGPVGGDAGVDSLIAHYFGSDDDGAAPAAATPKEEAGTHEPDTDNPDGHQEPEEGELDNLEEDEGGEEPGVEEDEEEPSEETLPDEDDEVEALLAETDEPETGEDNPEESFLPPLDTAKLLKDHPELEKPYKHMQAAFTKSMNRAAKLRKEAEAASQKATAMEQNLLAFQQTLEGDESFEEFLVQVSLNRPEVMERAYERALSLNEDEGKKKEYLREQQLAKREQELQDREKQDQLKQRQHRTTEIIDLTHRVAKRLGLNGQGDIEVAEQYVVNQILRNHADNGVRDLSSEQIVAAVRKAAKALAKEKESVRKAVKTETRQKSLKAAQERLRAPKRPAPPRSASPGARVATPERIDNRPKQSALDSWIDEQLGVDA